VRDVRSVSFDRDPDGSVYYPFRADAKPYLSSMFVACAQSSCSDVISRVAARIDAVHPNFRIRSAGSLRAALGGSITVRSFQAMLFGAFGLSAVLIVGAGVLGLVAMVTSRRTREVGVRMALGATSSDVTALIVRQELAAVLAGLVAGALMAIWSAALVRSLLYKISAYEPAIWLTAIIVLLGTAAAGAFIPALRASRIDPVKALRID
jgi:ABC-type antimicrobial peptide transport system permease subunit